MSDLHALCDGSLDEALAALPSTPHADRVRAFFQRPDVALFWVGGNCPVQAEGQIQGRAFDFRARGQRWTVSVTGTAGGAGPWSFEAPYGGATFDAGWMETQEAIGFIADALGIWDATSRTQQAA